MEHNISNTTYTDMTNKVSDYSVTPLSPDATNTNGMTFYDYPESSKYFGYYKSIPELKKAIDALSTWTCGKGYEVFDDRTRVNLEFMKGWGEDSFQAICWNLIVQKKIFGDAFAQIVRDKEDRGRLLNLKPLYTGAMRVVVNEKGIVDHYEQRSNVPNGKPIILQPHQVLHLVNDRVANEIHGVSVIEACKWVIDARNEAMKDWRRISHRSTIRVMYIDIDNPTKIAEVKTQYSEAINKGELMIIPAEREEAEFEDLQLPPVEAFMRWTQYLENNFYQAVGVPRVIATSENFTEAASKVGYLTFEPIYTREQTELEADLLAQVGIRLKFNRPPSLSGMIQSSEDKNTGQTGFQPNEVQPSITKNE